MDQVKVGKFLRELRTEKGYTQEQLAERLGVTNRSISRWEHAATMPDFDLVIQLSQLYGVEVGEILDGERKRKETEQAADKPEEETILKIAEYNAEVNDADRKTFSRRLNCINLAGLMGILVYLVLDLAGLRETYPFVGGVALGVAAGALINAMIFTGRYGARIRAAKLRLWKRIKGGDR